MAEMIRVVNKESQNLHAEMLLRLVGLKVEGEGSAAKGHEAVAELAKRLGVPDEGWGLADGSGLARTDLITPRGLVALLVAMDRHPHAAAFRDSLPMAGVDGTLEKRMRGTAAEGRVARQDRDPAPRQRAGRLRHDRARRAAGVRGGGEQPRGEEPRSGRRDRRRRRGARRPLTALDWTHSHSCAPHGPHVVSRALSHGIVCEVPRHGLLQAIGIEPASRRSNGAVLSQNEVSLQASNTVERPSVFRCGLGHMRSMA